MNLCRTLLLLGLAASGLSMYDTLSHAWDPSFEAPALSLGRRHTNYHAFREFTLSVGVAAVLIWGMFQPAGRRRPPMGIPQQAPDSRHAASSPSRHATTFP